MEAPSINYIGPYKVIEEVGAGGLGRVFKAKDPDTGDIVAVKILYDKFQNDKRILGLFHKEMLTVSSLKHKHIVEYRDASFQPPYCYIVSEFVDGLSLHQFMKKAGKTIPPLVALSICLDILQGLDYLHLHDTFHSDLSSPNVIIGHNGKVFITDFGLAVTDEVDNIKGPMVGTPGYFSPEHVSVDPMVAASDVYCAGLLLYEMLMGKKAASASKSRSESVANMKKIDFSGFGNSIMGPKAQIKKLVKKSLKYNQMFRYKSAEEMIVDIYKILVKNNIQYTRYAVLQFMVDQGMTDYPLKENAKQDIYRLKL